MKNLLQSEIRKLIYLRANWLLLLWSGLFAALGTVAPIMVLNSEERGMGMGFSGTNTAEGINAVFANAAGGYLFALIMGILIMTNEFRHGTAVGTFLVTPKRATVLYAKLIAASLAGLVVQIFSYLTAISSGFIALTFFEPHAPVPMELLWKVLRAAVLSGLVLGIVGVGLGALVKNQVAAVTGAVIWTLIVEGLVVAFVDSIGKYLPAGAITGLVDVDFGKNDFNFSIDNYLTPGPATLVLLAYAAVFSVLALRTTLRRDLD
jgi:ABC-type transport system involved in multi-copper enzyme maturation permease subunit